MNDNNDYVIRKIFSDILDIHIGKINDKIEYNSFENWDSIRYLQIIAAIEEEFDVEFLFEDIYSIKTFGDVKRILSEQMGKK